MSAAAHSGMHVRCRTSHSVEDKLAFPQLNAQSAIFRTLQRARLGRDLSGYRECFVSRGLKRGESVPEFEMGAYREEGKFNMMGPY